MIIIWSNLFPDINLPSQGKKTCWQSLNHIFQDNLTQYQGSKGHSATSEVLTKPLAVPKRTKFVRMLLHHCTWWKEERMLADLQEFEPLLRFNNQILEPAISHQLGMWPVQIRARTLSGIHLMPSNIQQFNGHAQSYPHIWRYIIDTWVSHSVSTLSNKWYNHKVLATWGYNNCSALSDTFIINHCCHRTSRSWWS